MKQSKLRKRRVWRYAVLYFALLIIFLLLLVGPILIGKLKLLDYASIQSKFETGTFAGVFAITGLNNNDTLNRNQTGTGCVTGTCVATGSAAASTGAARVRLF